MNRKTLVRGGALLLILIVLVTGCGNSGTTPTTTGPEPSLTSTTLEETSTKAPTQDDVPRITIDELLALMNSQGTIVIVDTRSKVEYDMDHITGSVSAPLSAIQDGEWEPPSYEQVILYCA